jgi:ribonuclease J
MDHAAFDAYAFLVRAEGESLLYTGDFRAHGRKWKSFYTFTHIAPRNVDYLLMEGTTLSRNKKKSPNEEELEKQFVTTFEETKGINFVYVSGQNIDRLVTIFRACKKRSKIFVIDFYIATILSELAGLGYGVPYPSAGFSGIRVFFPCHLQKKMEEYNRNDIIDRFKQYEISKEEIDEKANAVVMTVRPSMDYEIKSFRNLSGGNIIYSMWEGYKENNYTERFLSFLAKRGMILKTIHTSGHADYPTQKKLLDAVQPKKLIPIHTAAADQYQEAFPESNVKLAHIWRSNRKHTEQYARLKRINAI